MKDEISDIRFVKFTKARVKVILRNLYKFQPRVKVFKFQMPRMECPFEIIHQVVFIILPSASACISPYSHLPLYTTELSESYSCISRTCRVEATIPGFAFSSFIVNLRHVCLLYSLVSGLKTIYFTLFSS